MSEQQPPPNQPGQPPQDPQGSQGYQGSQGVPPPPQPGPPPMGQQPMGGPPPVGVPRPGELGDRFLARLIDGVGLGIVYGIFFGILSAIFLSGFSDSVGEVLIFYIFLSIITTLVNLGYYVYFESDRGATIGKQLMKLKVVGPDGTSHPTVEQAVRRNIFLAFGLASIVPIVGQFLGGLASLVAVIMIAVGINGDTARRQGWHDKLAGGTQVLKIG